MQLLSVATSLMITLTSTAIISADGGETFRLQFVGEDGKPIAGARFYLRELENGTIARSLYRDHELNDAASIVVERFPKEFQIGLVKKSDYYYSWWTNADLNLVEGVNVIRVARSGVVEFVFSKSVPEGVQNQANPMSLQYFRKSATGEYQYAGAIGVVVGLKTPIGIFGLTPSEYRFVLRDEFDDLDYLWTSEEVTVSKQTTVRLMDLTITHPLSRP